MDVHGEVEAGFGAVGDAFCANFAGGGDVGAACCVYVGGRPVVDIWGGVADPASARPWERDTPVIVFSTTKGATAVCVHMLVERGLLDVDEPIATYWPEFAAEGKGDVPLRWALAHRVGIPAIDGAVTLDDVVGWHGVVAAVAAQRPEWESGTTHGYHARSFGWMLGEVVRRVTGQTLGSFFATEVAGPLGLDWWIGTPEDVLRSATVEGARVVQSDGTDAVLGRPTTFGLGFAVGEMLGTDAPATAVGHPGAGGSLGFGDPASGIAFGYVMNRMSSGVETDERAASLVRAVVNSTG